MLTADFIEAITVTASSDTLSLARSTGLPSWWDVLGPTGGFLVAYTAVQAVSRKRERGVGVLNCASHTLHRLRPLMSWDGVAYRTSTPAPLDFGGFETRIRCAPSPGHHPGATLWTAAASGTPARQQCLAAGPLYGGASNLTESNVHYIPYLWGGDAPVVGWGCSGGGFVPVVYAAIHQVNTDGRPGRRLNTFDNYIAITGGGLKTHVNSTVKYYPPGWYYLAARWVADPIGGEDSTPFVPDLWPPATHGPAPGVGWFRSSASAFETQATVAATAVNTGRPVIFLTTSATGWA